MTASPPTTPPTIAPTGVEECDEDEDEPEVMTVPEDGVLEEPADCDEAPGWITADPPCWTTADPVVVDTPDAMSAAEETTVVPRVGDSPGGYCVPVLIPSAPVKIGMSIAWFRPA